MFDRYEAVELLQSLVCLARNEAHEKADVYAATLDEVKATYILKSSSGASAAASRGFRYTRPKPYGNTWCFNCNRFGHMARECFFQLTPF